MSGKTWKTMTTEELCAQADAKLHRRVGKYGVSESSSTGYARDMAGFLDRAQQIADAGDKEKAFLYSLHIFRTSGIEDIDDGYGAVYDEAGEYVKFWKTLLSDEDDGEIYDLVFRELMENIDGKIVDFQEDLLIEFLFDTYGTDEKKEDELLAFARKKLIQAIIEDSFRAGKYEALTAPILARRGTPVRQIAGRLAPHQETSVKSACLNLCLESDDPELQYCVLKMNTRWVRFEKNKDSARQTKRLEELEEDTQIPETYREFFAFCADTPQNTDVYEMWKERFPEDLWPILQCHWFNVTDRSLKRAFAVKTGNGILIADTFSSGSWSAGTDTKDADKLVPLLRDSYPLELFQIYYKAFKTALRNIRNRSQYAEVAQKLKSLESLKGADIAVPMIEKYLVSNKAGSPAFIEEMEKCFPGCSRFAR